MPHDNDISLDTSKVSIISPAEIMIRLQIDDLDWMRREMTNFKKFIQVQRTKRLLQRCIKRVEALRWIHGHQAIVRIYANTISYAKIDLSSHK